MRFAKLYRYRMPGTDAYTAGIHDPSVRTLVLRSRADPSVWLELRLAASPEALEREPVRPPEGFDDLVQLFPGRFLPKGSVLEAEEELLELSGSAWIDEEAQRAAGSLRAWNLGAALARRLAPIVPAAFLEPALADWIRDWLVRSPGDLERSLTETVESLLDALQDEIAESLAVKWPSRGRPGDPPLPGPECEVRDGVLHVRFGEDDDPIVELDPIPLSELGA